MVGMTTTRPTTLLGDALDAHGGLTRWNGLRNVEASLVSGGLLYDLKGQPSDRAARQIRVTLREVYTALRPFGARDQSMVYTCARTVIEKTDGTVVADVATDDVRRSFAGHTLTTAWNPLQRAFFFSGYALWTYLNSPFLLARPDVELYPVPAVEHHGEALPGIGVVFPQRAHSQPPSAVLLRA